MRRAFDMITWRRLARAGLLGAAVLPLSVAGVPGALAGTGAAPRHAAPHALSQFQRPPMGWSSWSTFHGNISEKLIEAQAAAMKSRLAAYGYSYVNIDAGWSNAVDANGRNTWDTAKFPDGIPAVAKYVHGLGLKFGIYLVPGVPAAALAANSPILGTKYHVKDIVDTTKPGNTANDGSGWIDYTKPGATAYVQSQVNLLASWGVDYVKMDFVGPGGGKIATDNQADIKAWHTAIARSGRPIHLELSNSLAIADAATWEKYSNGWRIEGDVECYSHCTGLTNWNVRVKLRFADAPKWVQYAGPGHWNDLDSLEIGNGTTDGLSADEKQSTATLWSIESAPLLLGTDLSKMDAADLALITNPEVIAVDQAGHPAHPVSQATPQQVWFSKDGDGTYTVALFNLADTSATVSVNWAADLGIKRVVQERDLWTHTNLGSAAKTGYSATLPAHGSVLLKVTVAGH
jgi:alpha-galactosidase